MKPPGPRATVRPSPQFSNGRSAGRVQGAALFAAAKRTLDAVEHRPIMERRRRGMPGCRLEASHLCHFASISGVRLGIENHAYIWDSRPITSSGSSGGHSLRNETPKIRCLARTLILPPNRDAFHPLFSRRRRNPPFPTDVRSASFGHSNSLTLPGRSILLSSRCEV